MRVLLITLGLCLAAPVLADSPETLTRHILPGYAAFADTTAALAATAAQTCDPQALHPGFQAAYDAWIGVQHLRFGPVEAEGLGLAIQFWPDPKGSGAKAQRALLLGDPAALAGAGFADQSVAARGLSGLERLLYPTGPFAADIAATDPCPLIRATASDLARMAAQVNADWIQGYGALLLTAGDPGNTTFLTPAEVRQVLFTQVIASLEFLRDQRLARPLGSFDQPRPERAESVASGRSLRNVQLSLAALRAMVETLTPDVPRTLAAFDHATDLARALQDPVFADVATPQGRLRVEILQQAVTALRDTALAELGPALAVGIGFNAADGD